MKKCIVVSDSFKGTLSSQEICTLAAQRLEAYIPGREVVWIPVADGGEGTVACFHEACGGTLVSVPVSGPYGEAITAEYLQLPGGQAVIEMASAAGLPQVEDRKDPCKTTTYGVGQLIRHAVEAGNQNILLGLGGSCTNDGGCGCAAALGVQFLRADGSDFVPVGGTLSEVADIDTKEAEKLLAGVSLTAMCDIDNPLYGPTGAACVFAPQKGADEATVVFLDGQLRALAGVIEAKLGRSVAALPGAGAAGGLGAGMVAFLGAQLRPGIEAGLADELINASDAISVMATALNSNVRGGTMPQLTATEAAVQENQRVMGILTCQEAKGREQLATMLAGQQGMSVEQARAILAAAAPQQPVASAQSEADRIMACEEANGREQLAAAPLADAGPSLRDQIMALDEAKGAEAQAEKLAACPGMTVENARAVLAAGSGKAEPVSASTTALFEHFMANHSPAAVRGGVSQTSADGDADVKMLMAMP